MIVALVFAHVWGVIQLIVLGSLARTVRVRTVLMALAVGLYVCAPLAVLLQMGWIRPAAWLTDVPVYAMAATAGYTADPFIEEIVKVLPIAALLLIPAMRRQWSLTDCVLTGAAAGSGFGLAESLFRYGAAAHRANSIDQGWMLTTNASYPVVPSVWSTINSWLPEAAVPFDKIAASGRFPPNVHLVWSALGGLAVGLIMLRRGWRWRTLAAVLLVYVAVDHTAWNAALRSQEFIGRAAIEQLRTLLWLSPILALALAWWLDRQSQHAGKDDEVSLAAEQSASPRLVGTVRAAISRLPGSLTQVYGFVRMRRACTSARTSPLPSRGPDDLSTALVQLRDRIDGQLGQNRSSPLLPPGWRGVLGAALRRPSVIVWLLLMVPSVMWFVIGGLPRTAALQQTMTQPLAWKAIVVLSVLAQTWLAWRVVQGLRASPTLLRLPSGDDAALSALQIACGVGAIGLGGDALMRTFSGFSPNSGLLDLHSTEAWSSASLATALLLANGAAGAVPPRAAKAAAARPSVKLPRNPYPAKGPALKSPPNPSAAADEEKAAQSAFADAATDYAIAQMSHDDNFAAARKADMAAIDADSDNAFPHALADLQAKEKALAANVAAAKAASDLAAAHSTYDDDIDAAKAADLAARTADLDATPHAAADLNRDTQLKADELRARVAAADAAAKAAAAEAAYMDHLAAAKAADAAARAADPNADPHAADDVRAGAQAARDAWAAEVAAANARAAAAKALRDPAGAAADEARAADAAEAAAWFHGSSAAAAHAKAEAVAAQARADAAAAAKEAAALRAAGEKMAYEKKWKPPKP